MTPRARSSQSDDEPRPDGAEPDRVPATEGGSKPGGSPDDDRAHRPIRIILADDHRLIRESLAQLIGREPDMALLAEAADGHEAVTLAEGLRPDVVVMDFAMPHKDGREAIREIREALPDVRVIGLSVGDSETTGRAMRASGAAAFVNKHTSPRVLLDAIRHHAGA